MDVIRNFGQAEQMQPQMIYHDTRQSSIYWYHEARIFHPMTERQFGNKFRVGDRVKVQVIYDNNKEKYINLDKMYINLTIAHITTYEEAKTWLGSYNIDDAFTRVLVLE